MRAPELDTPDAVSARLRVAGVAPVEPSTARAIAALVAVWPRPEGTHAAELAGLLLARVNPDGAE